MVGYTNSIKVVIGTKNANKISSARAVFIDVLTPESLDLEAYDAPSGVPDAPHGQETYQGALNRAEECAKRTTADYYVGIESGLVERYGNTFEEAWAVVIDKNGKTYIGYSSGLLLPPIVTKRLQDGELHNNIMEHYDKLFNLPEDNRDTWSRYTGGNISRQVSLDEALRNAIIQLMPSEQNLYNHR